MRRNEIKHKLETKYGKLNDREYTSEELKAIKGYYNKNSQKKDMIDDITWHDLDMDSIFMQVNNTNSSVGEEYLYSLLRDTSVTEETLNERDRVIDYFHQNETARIETGADLYKVGYAYKISLAEYIDNLIFAPKTNNLLHLIAFLSVILTVLYMVFVDAALGVVLFIIALSYDIASYYKAKAKVSTYFTCLRYVIKMNACAKSVSKRGLTELNEYNQKLIKAILDIKPILKGSFIISDGRNINGSIGEVFLDYIRIITHADLIIFNSIVKKVANKKDSIYEIYDTLGFLEAMIAIASYRVLLPYYSKPEFTQKRILCIEDAYHSLIDEPVTNSIETDKAILITGSNASGKSTFLKTVAINAILAQTIFTTTTNKYSASRFRIFSSMALSDNLSGGESYYIVEIKSLKRILNATQEDGLPVLFFIDEVLRGTNTIERIAASSQILKSLSNNSIGFAATHDIELAKILEKYYSNYHFSEEVKENDITFNYQIKPGFAKTRNAIKLLQIIGYNNNIIKDADEMANTFIKTNEWSVMA